MYLIHCEERFFKKEGKDIPFYKAVFSEDRKGYIIKRITKQVYEKLVEDLPCYVGCPIYRVLYDEYGRICDIEY